MLEQKAIDILLAIAGSLIAWVLKGNRDSINSIKNHQTSLDEKIAAVNFLVASDYIKREELDKVMVRIEKKLDHIDQKISGASK